MKNAINYINLCDEFGKRNDKYEQTEGIHKLRVKIISESSSHIKAYSKYVDHEEVYYAIIAQCYKQEARYLLYHNDLYSSDELGGYVDFNVIRDIIAHNNKYKNSVIKKTIKYLENAKNYCLKAFEINKEFAYDLIKIMELQSTIYYGLGDYNSFEVISKESIKYDKYTDSLINICTSNLICYYINKDFKENARAYFDLYKNYKSDVSNEMDAKIDEYNRLSVCELYLDYFYDDNQYSYVRDIIVDIKHLLEQSKNILDADRDNFMKYLNDKDDICKKRLKESSMIIDKTLLETKFDESIINMMDNQVKQYLTTTIYLFDYVNKYNSKNIIKLDYSSAIISAMKALERIMCRIINSYLKYIKSIKDDIDYNQITDKLKKGCQLQSYVSKIDYGTFILTITDWNAVDKKYSIIAPYFKDYYLLNNNIEQYERFITDLASKIYNISKLRNKAAHKDPFGIEMAEESFNILIENHINLITYMYQSFSFIFINEEE